VVDRFKGVRIGNVLGIAPESLHGGPFALVTTRPKGPKTGANQSVSAKDDFALDEHLAFEEPRSCHRTEVPGFVPDITARPWRVLVFLEWVFLSERLTTPHAN
jgi:hypothetical protein